MSSASSPGARRLVDRLGPPVVWLIAVAVTAVLAAFAAGYGYYRDELYFLAAGRHLAWSYADQGPLTPLIARAMDAVAPGSLRVLRLPAAVAAGDTVLVTGARPPARGGQLPIVTWLVVRAVRAGDAWLWPPAGVVLGIGLLNRPLPAFLAPALLAGVLVTGPRHLLRSPYVWSAALIALALWSPRG